MKKRIIVYLLVAILFVWVVNKNVKKYTKKPKLPFLFHEEVDFKRKPGKSPFLDNNELNKDVKVIPIKG